MRVHMAVDVNDQLIRACATDELAREWLTNRIQSAHGTQQRVEFRADPLLHDQTVVDVIDEPWLYGAYRVIAQDVHGTNTPEELSDDDS